MLSRLKRLGTWFDSRTGARKLIDGLLHERIRGGASVRYTFGSALAFTFALQALTGVLLAFHFSPSTTDAWPSVYYIQHEVTMGSLIRGVHHFGSSAMILLLVLHMVQTFLHGAYKAPREVNWLSGLALLALVLGLSLTGYLLPWDQKGFWATQVATNIIGSVPGVGDTLQTVALGGVEYGNLTLTRFFALHVFVLPGTLIAITGFHVMLMRRHGVTPKPGPSDEELDRTAGWFWPTQALMDLVVCIVVLAVLVSLALLVGAPLDAPADPSSNYEARPEWYFLFLFQLLKYFEGPMMIVGTVLLPTLAGLFLVALPFLDKGEDRRIRARKVWTALFFGGIAAIGVLTGLAWLDDSKDEAFLDNQRLGQRDACEAIAYAGLPSGGIDARGKVVLYEGQRLFRQNQCVDCHRIGAEGGQGETRGPDLTGYLGRPWLKRFLKNPYDDAHYGQTKLRLREDDGSEMPVFDDIPESELNALVEYLASLSGEAYVPPIEPALAEQGRKLFHSPPKGASESEAAQYQGKCGDCHFMDEVPRTPNVEDTFYPDLTGFGSRTWLEGLIQDPLHWRYFGGAVLEDENDPEKLNHLGDTMPGFDLLTDAQLEYLTAWLVELKNNDNVMAVQKECLLKHEEP